MSCGFDNLHILHPNSFLSSPERPALPCTWLAEQRESKQPSGFLSCQAACHLSPVTSTVIPSNPDLHLIRVRHPITRIAVSLNSQRASSNPARRDTHSTNSTARFQPHLFSATPKVSALPFRAPTVLPCRFALSLSPCIALANQLVFWDAPRKSCQGLVSQPARSRFNLGNVPP